MEIPDDAKLEALDDNAFRALKAAYGVRATLKADAIKALRRLRPAGRRKRPRDQEEKRGEEKGNVRPIAAALDPKPNGKRPKKKGGTTKPKDKPKKTKGGKKTKEDESAILDERDKHVLEELRIGEDEDEHDEDSEDEIGEFGDTENHDSNVGHEQSRRCLKCRSKWNSAFRCCPDCGGSLISRQCSKCSKMDEGGGSFCCWCGSGFDTASIPPPHQPASSPITNVVNVAPPPVVQVPTQVTTPQASGAKGGEETLAIKGNPLSIVFAKVVEAIKGAKFVELKELVPLEITRAAPATVQLSDGFNAPKSQMVIIEQHLIQSMPEWANAFTRLITIAREIGFGAVAEVWTAHFAAILDQANSHDWLTCATYDAVLRRTRAGLGTNNFEWDHRLWEATKDKRVAAGLQKGNTRAHNGGLVGNTGGRNNGGGGGAKPEKDHTCHGFNAPRGCTKNPCRFKHVCSKCRKDHPAHSCTTTPSA
jgi:hypothetical protein